MKGLIFGSVFIFLQSLLFADPANLPWKERHGEGWAWYHDFRRSDKNKEQKPLSPKQTLEIVKQEIEKSLAKAILEPTEANVLEYLKLQKKWIDQSQLFSEKWQRVILKNPEIAYWYPTTQYGVQVMKTVRNKQIKNLIENLSTNTILLFLYEGKSEYSQAFAQVVKAFALENNWPLKPISVDEDILPGFPDSISDIKIAEEMGLNIFPALFVVDPVSGKAKPLTFGMETISNIEEKLLMQFMAVEDD